MLITEPYREQYRRMYEEGHRYGIQGGGWADAIAITLVENACETVIDYGCGRGTLSSALSARGFRVLGYDPAIPGNDAVPRELADAVVSTDVLEHVEPECLDDVLDHVRGLTKVVGFHVICCRKAKRRLPDGSNPHRSVHHADRWVNELRKRFTDVERLDVGSYDELVVEVRP